MTVIASKGILEQYAERFRWQLLPRNILVEGESDRAYCLLAESFYKMRTGKSLIGVDLSVFPIGDGDEGGAYAIQENFQTLRNLAKWDLDARGQRRFHIVALFDGDPVGKKVARAIEGSDRSFELWRDVFWLQRYLPHGTIDPKALKAKIDAANAAYTTLDTVVEDLVCDELHELFAEANSSGAPLVKEVNGYRHYHYARDIKPKFRRFVETHADYDSVEPIIEMIRSMRYYLELDPDGT